MSLTDGNVAVASGDNDMSGEATGVNDITSFCDPAVACANDACNTDDDVVNITEGGTVACANHACNADDDNGITEGASICTMSPLGMLVNP